MILRPRPAAMFTKASREKREMRPRSRSLMRGWVAWQRAACIPGYECPNCRSFDFAQDDKFRVEVRSIPGLRIEILRLRSGQALGHPAFCG